MNKRSTNKGSRFRQLVQKAMDQKMEIANMKTCSILNKAKIEQQSIKIMELNKKVHTLGQQKNKYYDKKQTTEDIKRLEGEISQLKKTIDKLLMDYDQLVKDYIVKPNIKPLLSKITETLAAVQENEYKKNYNLIF